MGKVSYSYALLVAVAALCRGAVAGADPDAPTSVAESSASTASRPVSAQPAPATSLPRTDQSYRIRVKIDPGTRRIKGQERITWINRSAQTITRAPLHLYLNAFSHEGTTWMQDLRRAVPGAMSIDRRLELNPDPWGHMEPTSIEQVLGTTRHKVAWRPVQPDDGNPLDRTLIELTLPRPVAPGAILQLELRFEGRLPVPFARTGCTPTFCLVAQWFPKIGVHQRTSGRWSARQFHGMSEFFADFADYDVVVEAPRRWTLGATGRRVAGPHETPGGYQEVRYAQRAVHDFALVLGRELIEQTVVFRPHGGGAEVSVRYLLPRIAAHQLGRARRAVQGALEYLGRHLGPYPYTTLTVVMPPHEARATGGMEYPTLILGNTGDPRWDGFPLGQVRGLEGTLVHEFIHQYFYGLLASNEQLDGFLDEGFTTAWDARVMEALFGRGRSAGEALGRVIDIRQARAYHLSLSSGAIREPLSKRPTELFFPGTHRQQIYLRGAQSVWTAGALFGQEVMDRVFARYYRRYRFGHPTPEQFLRIAGQVGGAGLEGLLRESFIRERLPDFEVQSLHSRPYTSPRGRLTTPGGVVQVTREHPRADLVSRLDRRVDDQGGQIWFQVTDPGWHRGGESEEGRVTWTGLAPKNKLPAPASDAVYHESIARLSSPAWDHLPVTVMFTFEDGAQARETWDGRAAWRDYRVIRRARLTEVRIDPEERIQVDVLPQNNGLSLEPDRRFQADWGGWLGALVQWLAGGISLWL